MRAFLRLMLIFAALAYGAMPLSGMAMQGAAVSEQHHDAMAHMHSDDGDTSLNAASSRSDCGDKHGMFGCGHCAACLTLPALLMGLGARPFLHGAPMPAVSHQLFSTHNLPLLPPPRA
jgi:hypothetical protein